MGPTHTEEPRWAGVREVMGMSGPIILGSVSYTIMQFVDTIMVAKLGTDTLAAAGSAGVWSYTMGCLIFGVVGCVSTFAAQSLGRGEQHNCARYAWQGIYIAMLAGGVALVLWPLSGVLFRSMGHSPEVTRLELIYFRIRLLSYIPMAWVTALAAFFQAVNKPRVPMRVAILANVLNVELNYVLIFGKLGFPAWGIGGAAAATVIAMFVQAISLQWIFLSKPVNAQFKSRSGFGVDLVRIRELLRIGLPSGLSMFLDVANWGVFTSFMVGGFGAAALAAHNAAIQFMHVAFMPALGLNQGIAAIVGQYIGRGDIARAKARTYTAMRIAITYMVLVGLVFAVFGRTLIHTFFSKEPDVIALGGILLILAAIFQGFDAINIVCFGALRGAGDTRWMLYITFIAAYFVFLPLAAMLAWPLDLGAVGAWIGATVYIIGLSGALFRRFHGERWRAISIFSKS